ERYSERSSQIVNIFQANQKRIASHFTALRVLQILEWFGRNSRDASDTPVRELVMKLGALSYPSAEVIASLNHLGKNGLIESLSKAEPEWSEADLVRIGEAGKYYL